MRTLWMFLITILAALPSHALCAQGDTDTYRFSGGERIMLKFTPATVGEVPDQIVSDDGNISLPSGAFLNIKSKTYGEAKKLIADKMADATTVKEVGVQIVVLDYPPRKISIGGEVRAPKTITLTPGIQMSLLYAIQEAGGATDQADPTRVNVVHTDGDGKRTSQTIDITKLAQPGSADLGLRLQAGDTIVVPRGDHFIFSGEFNRVGVVSVGDLHLVPGEKRSLSRILAGIGGFKKEADVKKLKILRLKPDGTREVLEPFEKGVGATDPILQDMDIIEVPAKAVAKEEKAATSVAISGKVRTPGVYPIGENGLKLSKLIMLAGGMTSDAKGSKVKLNRPSSKGEIKIIDVDSILKNGAWDQDVDLKDGDIITVPEKVF